jgi:hypothetical protein
MLVPTLDIIGYAQSCSQPAQPAARLGSQQGPGCGVRSATRVPVVCAWWSCHVEVAKDKHGKSALHYDHNDSGTGYLGFSCALHNLGDGAHKRNAQRRSGRNRARRQVTYSPPDGSPGVGW